jgi:hypothetical protein
MSNGQPGKPGEPGQPGTNSTGGAGGAGGSGGEGGTFGGRGGSGGKGGSVSNRILNVIWIAIVLLVVFSSVTSVYLYAQLNHEASVAKATAAAAVAKAQREQAAAAAVAKNATCQALLQLDNAKNGISFVPGGSVTSSIDEQYLERFTAALHYLVVVEGCEGQ